jgi:hypothetical protein
MKKEVGFIGVLVVFFNIFIFVGGALAEKAYKKEMTVNKTGIYQQTIEESAEIDWKIEFPPGFNQGCIKSIIGDHNLKKVKVGYSFECLTTETIFSLSQGGFLEVPNSEKWLMTIFEDGPKFISIPEPEIKKNVTLNIFGLVYFISVLILFWLIGYNYDCRKMHDLDKYLLIGVVGIGSLVIAIFNSLFLSKISGHLADMLGFLYFFVFTVCIVGAVLMQIKLNRSLFVKISICFGSLLIAFTTIAFFSSFESSGEIWEYFIFQMLLTGLAWSFGKIVLALQREEAFRPKMVKANRIFQYPLNSVEDEGC